MGIVRVTSVWTAPSAAESGEASDRRAPLRVIAAIPASKDGPAKMKTLIWIGMFAGGIAGGYVPVLFGASLMSAASLLGNTIGGGLGIALGYQIARYYDL